MAVAAAVEFLRNSTALIQEYDRFCADQSWREAFSLPLSPPPEALALEDLELDRPRLNVIEQSSTAAQLPSPVARLFAQPTDPELEGLGISADLGGNESTAESVARPSSRDTSMPVDLLETYPAPPKPASVTRLKLVSKNSPIAGQVGEVTSPDTKKKNKKRQREPVSDDDQSDTPEPSLAEILERAPPPPVRKAARRKVRRGADDSVLCEAEDCSIRASWAHPANPDIRRWCGTHKPEGIGHATRVLDSAGPGRSKSRSVSNHD